MTKINIIQKRFIETFICLTVLICCLFPAAVFAHRYHTSLARMDYNGDSKQIEISIQLFTHDAEKVFERQTGKNFNADKKDEIDDFLKKYLNENFVLTNQNGAKINFEWVGRETNVDLSFVYIQFPYEGDLSAANLQNTIFLESFAEQANLVICRFGENKFDLLYKAGDTLKELKKQPVQ